MLLQLTSEWTDRSIVAAIVSTPGWYKQYRVGGNHLVLSLFRRVMGLDERDYVRNALLTNNAIVYRLTKVGYVNNVMTICELVADNVKTRHLLHSTAFFSRMEHLPKHGVDIVVGGLLNGYTNDYALGSFLDMAYMK